MPTQLQFRRGTTAQNNSFTGVVGELTIDTNTDNIRVHDGSQAGGFEIIPSGTILPFGGSSVPGNFLLCDGSNVSRTTYARLFAVIGTAYGTGDGSGTFGLPDLRDRVALGKGTNNDTLGTETGSAAASSVITNATSNTGTGTTGTGNTGTGTTGTGNTGTGNTGTGTTVLPTLGTRLELRPLLLILELVQQAQQIPELVTLARALPALELQDRQLTPFRWELVRLLPQLKTRLLLLPLPV